MKRRGYLFVMLLASAALGVAGCKGASDQQDNNATKETITEVEETKTKDTEEEESVKVQQETDHLAENEIGFSINDYFCLQDTNIEIISKKPCTIYYTTDGKDPDKEQKVYEKPIVLSASQDLMAVCIKAKAYYEDGTESETIVHTYYVSTNIEQRFDTLVFSITTDPYNLYDYEYGIFVEGKLRADYKKEHPYEKIDPDKPANYNMRGRESEREVYLEIIEPDGKVITKQAAGVRTYGGWSRANLQKSIKLFARKEYDETNNKFRYEFFPNKKAANGSGDALDTFKKLVLRNCGNDNGFGFIRDELFQTLAGQAGYQDYEAVRPVTLFINGEYNGFYWLHEVYGDEYFEDHYGKYDGEFQILEKEELAMTVDEDGENSDSVADYETMYEYSKMDLTDDTNYEKLCQRMDVENYLSYYALQIYIDNEDWPHNNYKAYRYYAPEGKEYGEAPFDGKWRYLLHDLDFSYGIYKDGSVSNNIGTYIGPKGEIRSTSPMFGQLMQREDCKEIFIQKTMDLINGAFAPENLNAVLDEMNASRLNEIQNMYGKNLMANWVTFDMLPYRIDQIKSYGSQRAKSVITEYQQYFNLGASYELNVSPVPEGKVKINSFETGEYFKGTYFTKYNCTITATIPEGMTFDYWLVNGEKVAEEELIITSSYIKNDKVEVTCMVK